MKDSIYIIVNQCVTNFTKNVTNPVNWLYGHTGHLFTVTSYTKKVKFNCQAARKWISDYIQQRKRGERKSTLVGQTDILSLMLERQDVFTDELITDEMVGFFGAATETTHNVF